MIEVEGLRKRFGDVRAVDGVSFQVRDGEIYGLLGPNGAGKTTTLSMLSGLLEPDGGRILYGGRSLADEPRSVKRQLGTVPQDLALYDELTGRENLRFWGGLYGLSGKELDAAVDRGLARVGLEAKARAAVKTYSGGMKRRLNLALGLVHDPPIVLMDEPTVGIDPQARESILDLVHEIAAGGKTILYTTHYLDEAERLCDRIGILDGGRLLAEGSLEELNRLYGDADLIQIDGPFDADGARAAAAELDGARVMQAEDGRLVVAASKEGGGAVRLLPRLLATGLHADGIEIRPPSLHGLFLKLTGKELRDA